MEQKQSLTDYLLADESGVNEDPVRSELFALDSLFIENLWPLILKKLNETRGLIASGKVTPQKLDSGLWRVDFNCSFNDDAEFVLGMKQTPFQTIWQLRGSLSAIATLGLIEFCEENEKQPTDVYSRIKELLAEDKGLAGIDPASRVAAYIHKGLNTGIWTTFDLLLAIPELWFKEYGSVISEANFDSVAQASKGVISLLSLMQVKTFASLRDSSKEFFKEPLLNDLIVEFPKGLFVLQNEAVTLNLEFVKSWRKAVEAKGLPVAKRLGCPARAVKTGTQSVVQELYSLQVDLFKTNLLPYLQVQK